MQGPEFCCLPAETLAEPSSASPLRSDRAAPSGCYACQHSAKPSAHPAQAPPAGCTARSRPAAAAPTPCAAVARLPAPAAPAVQEWHRRRWPGRRRQGDWAGQAWHTARLLPARIVQAPEAAGWQGRCRLLLSWLPAEGCSPSLPASNAQPCRRLPAACARCAAPVAPAASGRPPRQPPASAPPLPAPPAPHRTPAPSHPARLQQRAAQQQRCAKGGGAAQLLRMHRLHA